MKKLIFNLMAVAAIGLLTVLLANVQAQVSCVPNPTGCTLTVGGISIQYKKSKKNLPNATIFPGGGQDILHWNNLNMESRNGNLRLNPAIPSQGTITPPITAEMLTGSGSGAASSNVNDFFWIISDPAIAPEPVANTTKPITIMATITAVPPECGVTYAIVNAPIPLFGTISGLPYAPILAGCAKVILQGDMDGNCLLTAADVVKELNCVFLGTGCPVDPCADPLLSADVNCDGVLTAADVVILLNMTFLGTPPSC